jgi:hypothetical protein
MLFMTGLTFLTAAAALSGEPANDPSVELVLARAVVHRRPSDVTDPFFAGEKLVAWTSVAGVAQGFVEHVWYRDGQEVARHYLPIGHGRPGTRWRTWSRHEVREGEYTVEVLAPDGKLLARRSFTVRLPDEMPGC